MYEEKPGERDCCAQAATYCTLHFAAAAAAAVAVAAAAATTPKEQQAAATLCFKSLGSKCAFK